MISSRLFVISITDIHPMTQSRSCFPLPFPSCFLLCEQRALCGCPPSLRVVRARAFVSSFLYPWDSRVVRIFVVQIFLCVCVPLTPPSAFFSCVFLCRWISHHLLVPSSAILCVIICHAFSYWSHVHWGGNEQRQGHGHGRMAGYAEYHVFILMCHAGPVIGS